MEEKYLATVHNCEELLSIMRNNIYNSTFSGNILFQGDSCEVGGMNPGSNPTVQLSPYKYPNVIWIIGDSQMQHTDTFILGLAMHSCRLDEVFGVVLPKYVYKELLYTLRKGYTQL